MGWKRMTAIMLSCCVITGLISGCSSKGDRENADADSTEAAGTYIEEDVELPLKQDETILRLLKNAQGTLEIYAQGGDGAYTIYTSSDGDEWAGVEALWLNQASGKVVSLAAGRDGNDYAIVADDNAKMHLLKQTPEGTGVEINVPELNEADDNNTDSAFFSFGTELAVMENGNLVLEGAREVRVYSQADGKLLYSIPYEKTSTDARNPVDINGENIVLPDTKNTGFTVWNAGEEAASMSYNGEVRYGKVILEEDNEIYFLNEDGIHHMQPNGTLVETLAEGASLTMGLPGAYAMDFVKGTGEDFYALYTNSGKMSVKHYYYGKAVKKDSSKTLNIYSLEENATVRQAVSIFKQKYPEAEVSYLTGESDTSTTKADKIRVLNTELLNKSGADVLILDGLPMDSLIEKGVLNDISDIISPLIEDGTLPENLAGCYKQEDGKIYGMPVRYGVPILYGDQELTLALEKLDTLESWLKTHEDQPVFTGVTYDEITSLFVSMYAEELFDEDGKLNQDKLEQCLSCAKEIGERAQAEMEQNYSDETMEAIEETYFSDWNAGNGIGVMEGRQVASYEIESLTDMMIPFTVMRENNLPFLANQNTFIPHGLVGINSASSVTELAEEFVEILFSDEVQEYDLGDGFPMNQNAQAKLTDQGMNSLKDQENGNVMGVSGSEDGSKMYSFGMPLKTEVNELWEKSKELKKPAKTDSVLLDMIFEEAKAYYEGKQEAGQTVSGIAAKVDTYLAE